MSFILLASGGERTAHPASTELYGVDPNGDLRWYRYDGSGVASPAGSVGWGPNSRNVIGNGWNNFMFLCGGQNGQLFAVEHDGDFHWYDYTAGDGVEDRAGARGWDGNSGNPIGNGWNGFSKLVSTSRSGVTDLYGVAQNGDLQWYRYTGHGVADRSGNTGWAANSGNAIGNGWNGFQLLFSAGTALFGVDPNGDLRWYSYIGEGVADRSGNTGWAPNSGNAIGRGWNNFRTIVGGPGQQIFAVDQNGDLRWYKYDGHGESDPSGSRGWHANSGNQIGRGW